MLKTLILNTILFSCLTTGMCQEINFLQLPEIESYGNQSRFDLKYFGDDSILVCRFYNDPAIFKLDLGLNIIKSAPAVFVPDSIANSDSLQDVTVGSCKIGNDGFIRTFGNYMMITNQAPHYTGYLKFSYKFDHNLDSIGSGLENYSIINDSLEIKYLSDSLRYFRLRNRNSGHITIIPFESIINSEWESPGGLFWFKILSSKQNIFMVFQSNHKLVITSLNFQGNLMNQKVVDKYSRYNAISSDTGFVLVKENSHLIKLSENLDTIHSLNIDSNEVVRTVIKDKKDATSYYLFSTDLYLGFIKYYKWIPTENSLKAKGIITNSNFQIDFRKVVHVIDSSFLITGNIREQGADDFTSFIAHFSGNPAGNKISFNGREYELFSDETNSFESLQRSNNFKIFPNPVENNLNVYNSTGNKFDIVIYDLSGKIVISLNNISNNRINLSQLNKGVYILKTVDKYASETFKLIKL